ncbi:unnamed protein product [Allacma fusca]|uniref:Uncharacterized protein n=1 Tax=Allacma fusca TaxID=39272 RepID=A0A8J2LPY8_9HEXA|nr:unnamed protein product [Allacma fusca]
MSSDFRIRSDRFRVGIICLGDPSSNDNYRKVVKEDLWKLNISIDNCPILHETLKALRRSFFNGLEIPSFIIIYIRSSDCELYKELHGWTAPYPELCLKGYKYLSGWDGSWTARVGQRTLAFQLLVSPIVSEILGDYLD